MLRLIFSFLIFTNIFANNIDTLYNNNKDKIEQIILENKQKETFKNINEEKTKQNRYYDVKKLDIKNYDEKNCYKITQIKFIGNTKVSTKELNKLAYKYLNKCNGIKKLNNLNKEISNLYINKGYVTSRAYLKAQNLLDKQVLITILEGKINSIKGKNVYINNTFANIENEVLNIRVLEDGIYQYEKIRSKKVDLKLLPSSKVGYTDVLIDAKDTSKPYYGNIVINNFGSERSGKYQVSFSYNYENLFGINDILRLSLNTSNTAFKKTNNSLGKSLSYSLPYINNYFTFSYSTFDYSQTIYDDFGTTLQSKGNSYTYSLNDEYDLFHNNKHNILINANITRVKNTNYLNDVLLQTQSNIQSTAYISIKHSYNTNHKSYYLILKVKKGLDILGAYDNTNKNINKNYLKYYLDINYAQDVLEKVNGKLSTTFHTEYTKDNLHGTEQISIGGPYSVRGFKGASLNGYRGFYIRNELTINTKYKGARVLPFIGLDYGYIKKQDDITGGTIIGSSIGFKNIYKQGTISIYKNYALKYDKNINKPKQNFIGVSFEHKF